MKIVLFVILGLGLVGYLSCLFFSKKIAEYIDTEFSDEQ